MNEQISLAYSLQPTGKSSIALSVIPLDSEGTMNMNGMASANISAPAAGSPEAALLASVSEAVAAFRSAKGL
jgi:hypothetical protein